MKRARKRGSGTQDLDAEIDALYALSPVAFTAARNALGARLRGEGHKTEATKVKGLKRPGPTAFGVNLLHRQRHDDLEALLEAGDEARAAQLSALKGEHVEDLRAALDARNKAVTDATHLAAELMREAKVSVSAAVEDRLRRTLQALADSPNGRDLLAGGRLLTDVDPPGLSVLMGLEAALPTRPRRAGDRDRELRKKQVEQQKATARKLAEAKARREQHAEEDRERAEAKARARAEADEAQTKEEAAQARARRKAEADKTRSEKEVEQQRKRREAEQRRKQQTAEAKARKHQQVEETRQIAALRRRVKAAEGDAAEARRAQTEAERAAARARKEAERTARLAEKAEQGARKAEAKATKVEEDLADLERELRDALR
ncbi:hypothetical protein [Chondromyces apiculatus]|uniref:Uncharacterized protein n=1 Tax=Chondromyces apiculatus DSM 436 TaxID=1192034 RepID=A0A017SZV4_9BACT|nr:hypothetical protein [Chondromyces apiculatus]EYF02498.1 Hypothetical protein CAP_7120 [Chondromyces apiculatus DSM 436]